jgi:hypothetical protein
MLEILVPSWNLVFNEELPRINESASNSLRDIVPKYTDRLMRSVEYICPRTSGPFRRLEPNFAHLEGDLRDKGKTIITELRDAAKQIHRKVRPLVAGTMEEAYNNCRAESGEFNFQI